MKFGVNAFLWTAQFGEEHLPLMERVKSWGYDGIELFIADPAAFPAQTIYQGLVRNGLGLTVVTVAGPETNPISADAAVRAKAVTHFEDCIKRVADAGGEMLCGPVYAPLGVFTGTRRTEEEWKRGVEFFQKLGPALETNRVTLAVEPLNRFETYFLNTAADAVRLCMEVDHSRVGILFDTFHANIEEKSVPDAYRRIGPFLKHVHTCENDRGTPGTGHVDWTGVFQALDDIDYDGWLTIESFGAAIVEIAAAARIWRDLEKDGDTLAIEGLKFLKSNFG